MDSTKGLSLDARRVEKKERCSVAMTEPRIMTAHIADVMKNETDVVRSYV